MAAITKTWADGDPFTAAEADTYFMRQVAIACNNQTDRDAILSPQEGMLVYRKDLDLFQFYNGTRWALVAPKDYGQTYPGSNFTLTASYTDRIAPAAITTNGGTVEIEVCIAYYNSASGADRTIDVKILRGATVVKTISGLASYLMSPYGAQFTTFKVRDTPSAGSNTYKVQVLASTGSAVIMTTDSYMTLKEIS